jgi:hypothetical protein
VNDRTQFDSASRGAFQFARYVCRALGPIHFAEDLVPDFDEIRQARKELMTVGQLRLCPA